MITEAILEQAAANGDMTRAGVVAAANEVDGRLQGPRPDQTWAGDPNDYIVRESYMYDVDARQLQPGHRSARARLDRLELLEGPFVCETAADYTSRGPCFEPTG